jgi:hypothetical protein
MTDEERHQFRKAALEYLRDPDAVTDSKVQARIADEIERLAAENRKLKKSLHYLSSARETDMGTAE